LGQNEKIKMKSEKLQLKEKNDIKARAFNFSLSIIDLLKSLPRDYIYQTLGKQLLRASTSIGANIIEAQAGSSKRDFTNYLYISLKSANETKYWLAILREKSESSLKQDISKLLQECQELGNILGASILTIKGRRNF